MCSAVCEATAISVAFKTCTSSFPSCSTATGGSIISGLYTAGSTAGDYVVIATYTSGLTDTALVTIASSTDSLIAVTLTPNSATLRTGAQRTFSAHGVFQSGATAPVSVTYVATGGTIASNGLYTAGSTEGRRR